MPVLLWVIYPYVLWSAGVEAMYGGAERASDPLPIARQPAEPDHLH
jgi:hypothetical protein